MQYMNQTIFYFNFDVGSAIEYAGDIFYNWMRESRLDVYNYKQQNFYLSHLRELRKYKPKLIILNEFYESSCIASTIYKTLNPCVTILPIFHVWSDILNLFNFGDGFSSPYLTKRHKELIHGEFISSIDGLMIVNYLPPDIKLPEYVKTHNIINAHYPCDPNVFNVKIPWKERENNFCYLGNILPHKMSEEFINRLNKTDIHIDCYGRMFEDIDREDIKKYLEKFKNCKNLHYKGLVPQKEVSNVYNKYKYFVLPHRGMEPFNFALLQAMFCGTIPLVCNDMRGIHRAANYPQVTRWLDWADGLYYGCETPEQLIDNLNLVIKNNPDSSTDSRRISNNAMNKFNYFDMKHKFISLVQDLLLEDNNKIDGKGREGKTCNTQITTVADFPKL